ncbi:MAG: alpha/beta fold hydrolase [Pseudomonadota bacterium]
MRLAEIAFPKESETKPPLIVAHGLFGAARNWRAHAKRMGPDRRVIAVDMRNHGESAWDDDMSYAAMAGDLAETIEAHGARAAVMGHSMGGKAAMVLALTRPELVERLIVADIAPVAYGHDLMNEIEAMRGVDLTGLERRSEVEAALEAKVADRATRAFLAHSAELGGEPRWSLNLDALAADMDRITGFPEMEGAFGGRTFFLLGGASKYVQAAHRETVLRLFPNASYEAIKDAGHWLHADKPREFLDAANRFLES